MSGLDQKIWSAYGLPVCAKFSEKCTWSIPYSQQSLGIQFQRSRSMTYNKWSFCWSSNSNPTMERSCSGTSHLASEWAQGLLHVSAPRGFILQGSWEQWLRASGLEVGYTEIQCWHKVTVTLDKSVKPLCLSLIIFEMGKNGIYLVEFLWGLNKLMYRSELGSPAKIQRQTPW